MHLGQGIFQLRPPLLLSDKAGTHSASNQAIKARKLLGSKINVGWPPTALHQGEPLKVRRALQPKERLGSCSPSPGQVPTHAEAALVVSEPSPSRARADPRRNIAADGNECTIVSSPECIVPARRVVGTAAPRPNRRLVKLKIVTQVLPASVLRVIVTLVGQGFMHRPYSRFHNRYLAPVVGR